jgi:hypothetical protein
MESMIVLPANGSGLVNLAIVYHENSHQWWGDNVSDGNFDMTFFKEGMATLAVQLYEAREAEQKAGGPNTTAGRAAFERPKAALVALRRILGPRGFDAVLQAIQRRYAGSSITEPQLEAAFATRFPNHSAACQTRLSQFFTQWFDTAYHGAKPQITAPGLHGHPFYAHGCAAPGRR